MASIRPFSLKRYATRWLMAFFLVTATFNPSGYSYIDWIMSSDGAYLSFKITIGIILVGVYITLWPMVWAGMGPVGIFNTLAWVTAFSFVCWDYGLLEFVSPSFYPYGVLATLATVIANGLVFNHLQLQFWGIKPLRKVAPIDYSVPR